MYSYKYSSELKRERLLKHVWGYKELKSIVTIALRILIIKRYGY